MSCSQFPAGVKVKEIVKRCQNDPAISKLCKGGITYQTVAHLQRKYVKRPKKEPKEGGDENSADDNDDEGDDQEGGEGEDGEDNKGEDGLMDPVNDTAANEFKVCNSTSSGLFTSL